MCLCLGDVCVCVCVWCAFGVCLFVVCVCVICVCACPSVCTEIIRITEMKIFKVLL